MYKNPGNWSPDLVDLGQRDLLAANQSLLSLLLILYPVLCSVPAAPSCPLLPPPCPLLSHECYQDDEWWVPTTQPDTADVQAITDKMKFQLEERENQKFPTFKATEFKSQLVTGTNYFIKVQVEMMILYTFECLKVSHMKTSLWPCTLITPRLSMMS